MAIQHASIADPYLHEPKGIATATDGEVYVADGLGAGTWRSLSEFTGAMVITNNATPLALTAATDGTLATFSDYVQITGFAAGELDKITFASNELVLPAEGSGLYLVNAYLSAASDTINSDVAIKFTINGASGVARRPRQFLASTNEYYNMSAHGIVRLTTADSVGLYVASDKSIGLTIQDAAFSLHKVGE